MRGIAMALIFVAMRLPSETIGERWYPITQGAYDFSMLCQQVCLVLTFYFILFD